MSTTSGRISSELATIGELLKSDFRYSVPPHQRNFSWTLEEVRQLWQDIEQAMRDGADEYFLGSIVVQEDRDAKSRTVIDGQQRLASLMMIFAALRSVYQAHEDGRQHEVYNDFLGVRDRRTRETECRVTLNELNQPIFDSLVIEHVEEEVLRKQLRSAGGSNALLIKAAQFLREAIRLRSSSGRYEDFLLELEDFVSDRIRIILVAVGDEADAYLIFETLNDRGLDLSISDLLKNYIFGKAGSKFTIVKKQWEEMALLLGQQNETQFLRHYWLSKYEVVRERDLYKAMKKRFANMSAVVKLMSELREAADKYAAISNVDHQMWKGTGTAVRKDLETLQLFALSQFKPLLIAAIDSLPDDLPKLIRLIVVISLRYSIICSLGTGNIEKAYSDAAIAIRNGKAKSVAKVFALLKGIYPDDVRFETDFANKDIAKARLARHILAAVANQIQGSKELGVLEDENKVTLEHIMPQTKSAAWKNAAKDDDDYVQHVNRLGNLTLIERDRNRAASNVGFDTKKAEAFSKSDIAITKDLCSHANWNVGTIAERQAQLAKHAKKVWSISYAV